MSQSVMPPFLKKADKVGFVAPAGKVEQGIVAPAFDVVEGWGLKIVRGEHLFSSHGYFAGTDQQRLTDLQTMINDPEIKAIFCLRGGYGVTRIIEEINVAPLVKNPKWIIGFSDITALHLKLAKIGLQSIHGIMPVHFNPEKAGSSLINLKEFLFGNISRLEWPSQPNNIKGKTKGKLIGGNLSILADSMGTKDAPDGTDIILFIEEIDEYLYKIDRMLMQLKRNGLFEKVKGLAIGHFTSMKDTKIPFGDTLENIILDKVRGHSIPVAFGLPAGHDFPNFALPHNRTISLEVNDKASNIEF